MKEYPALNCAKTLKSRDIVELNGVGMAVKYFCKIFEVKLTTVLTRVNRDGMSLRDALRTAPKFKTNGKTAYSEAKKVKLYGQIYTVGEVARSCNIPPSTLRGRLNRGIPVHIAKVSGKQIRGYR